jgi:hypothetical protein
VFGDDAGLWLLGKVIGTDTAQHHAHNVKLNLNNQQQPYRTSKMNMELENEYDAN